MISQPCLYYCKKVETANSKREFVCSVLPLKIMLAHTKRAMCQNSRKAGQIIRLLFQFYSLANILVQENEIHWRVYENLSVQITN